MQVVEAIGKDILIGVQIADKIAIPIVGVFDPPLAPILAELSNIISDLEGKGATIDQATMSTITQAVSQLSVIRGKIAATPQKGS